MTPLIAAAILLAASPALAQEKQLLFEAPKGTSDADRLKAAKAFAARCVAHGFKDVTGDTVSRAPSTPRQIRLLSAKGFTDDMRPALEFLATFTCRKIELRLERFLSTAEAEEFKEGEKAPKGAKWTKHREWTLLAEPFPQYVPGEKEIESLFLEKPVIDASGKTKLVRHPGGDFFGEKQVAGVYLTFQGSLVKTMNGAIVPDPNQPKRMILPLNLFIDGVRFPTDDGSMGWRILKPKGEDPDLALWTFPWLTATSPIAWLLENPLPFPLTRVE